MRTSTAPIFVHSNTYFKQKKKVGLRTDHNSSGFERTKTLPSNPREPGELSRKLSTSRSSSKPDFIISKSHAVESKPVSNPHKKKMQPSLSTGFYRSPSGLYGKKQARNIRRVDCAMRLSSLKVGIKPRNSPTNKLTTYPDAIPKWDDLKDFVSRADLTNFAMSYFEERPGTTIKYDEPKDIDEL